MNDVLKSHLIELDDLSVRIFQHLKQIMSEEPPLPNGGEPRYLSEEMATAHYEWSRQRDAIRILLGVQLVNQGLEQLELKGGTDAEPG